jgi:mannose-6-phosphate isomerase
VQVHPNDDYAALKGDGTRGKTECWYVLDCETGGEIVLGHNAKTQEELQSMVTEKKWEQLLRRIPAAKDDFFYVASGTIHALKRGMLVLEIQQPSDTTYRLYDYDRLENGIPRQLHIQESLEVTTIPYSPDTQEVHILKFENITKATLADTSFFSVSRYDVQGRVSLQQDMPFLIMGVIEGQGKIDNVEIKKGDHWLLPYHYGNYVLEGNMTLIVSTKKN